MGFISQEQLKMMHFKSLGVDVRLSDKASIHAPHNIEIGDHSRIDDFCVLSAGEGGIFIGRYVHVACFCSLIGRETITLDDFSNLSSRVALYSSNDDYSGTWMTNPTVPEKYTGVTHAPVHLGRHVIVGVGSTILPGVRIGDGAAVAAYSLVTKDVAESTLVGGIPARRIKARGTGIFELERRLTEELP